MSAGRRSLQAFPRPARPTIITGKVFEVGYGKNIRRSFDYENASLSTRLYKNLGRRRRYAGTGVANSRRGPVGPHDRARAVPVDLGIARAKLPRPRMVPRREVRHLGALVGPVRAGTGRLVRAENVSTGRLGLRLPRQNLRPPLQVRLLGY